MRGQPREQPVEVYGDHMQVREGFEQGRQQAAARVHGLPQHHQPYGCSSVLQCPAVGTREPKRSAAGQCGVVCLSRLPLARVYISLAATVLRRFFQCCE